MGAHVQMAAHLKHLPGACAKRHSHLSSQQRKSWAAVLQSLLLHLSRQGGDSQLACSLSMCLQHMPCAHRVCQELYFTVAPVCLILQMLCLDDCVKDGACRPVNTSAGAPPRRSPRVQVLRKPQCYTHRTERNVGWTALDTTGVIGTVCQICRQSIQ